MLSSSDQSLLLEGSVQCMEENWTELNDAVELSSVFTARVHNADYAVARCLSVCPSVCPSFRYTAVFCLNGYTYPQSFCLHFGCHATLVFPYQTGWQYFDVDHPNGGAECKVVRKNHDFRPTSCFILEIMQDKAIVTMEAFEWYQFEWPWVSSNLNFKVTILFNVK